MTVSPSAIVDYLRLTTPEILQNPEKVRRFLSQNYPTIPIREAESVMRIARQYRNKQTPLETKLKNSIVTFPNR